MSDKKVSELVEANTLGNDDLLMIVQNGTNKKMKSSVILNQMLNILSEIKGVGLGTDIQLEDSSDNKIDILNISGNSIQKDIELPQGYTRVNFIQSSGDQYIDTGVKGTENTKIDISVMVTEAENSCHLLGTLESSTYSSITLNPAISIATTRFGNGELRPELSLPDLINTRYKFLYSKEGVYVNETFYSGLNATINPFTTIDNLLLFRTRNSSQVGKLKMYYCKIYNNNVLQRHFIPCFKNSNNEVGMYDLVSNTFFSNIGSGAFTYGKVFDEISPDCPVEIENVNKGFASIIIDNGLSTADLNYKEQQYTILTQNPFRAVENYRDCFVRKNGVWYEKHIIGLISKYNGETITTPYISDTGELSSGALVIYVMQNPTLIECTSEQIEKLNEIMILARTYDSTTHIYSLDEVSPNMEVTYFKNVSALLS